MILKFKSLEMIIVQEIHSCDRGLGFEMHSRVIVCFYTHIKLFHRPMETFSHLLFLMHHLVFFAAVLNGAFYIYVFQAADMQTETSGAVDMVLFTTLEPYDKENKNDVVYMT